MPKIKHQITVNGFTFTRTSESRRYTHAIIVPPLGTEAEDIAWAQSRAGDSGRQWDAYQAQLQPGATVNHWDLDRAQAFVQLNPDRDAYMAQELAHRLVQIQKAAAKGRYKWQPASWASSLALAQKAARSCYSARARVVEVGSTTTIDD